MCGSRTQPVCPQDLTVQGFIWNLEPLNVLFLHWAGLFLAFWVQCPKVGTAGTSPLPSGLSVAITAQWWMRNYFIWLGPEEYDTGQCPWHPKSLETLGC